MTAGAGGPLCQAKWPFLKLTETVAQVCVSSPWHQRKDVAGILYHSTERDDQQARELPMVSTKTHTRLLARLLHGLEAVEAARSREEVDGELRKVMLSSGGPGSGSMWIEPTRSERDLLRDAHFMMSTCEGNTNGRLCAILKYRMTPNRNWRNRWTAASSHSDAKRGRHACVNTWRLRQP